jgi:hypothetical protein
MVREFWIDQHWARIRTGERGRDVPTPELLAFEQAALVANWKTLLPGDEVVIPEGHELRWWSANHFVK